MARVFEKNYFIGRKAFEKTCIELYSAVTEETAERYSSLTEGLSDGVLFFSSSGRTELIGNHTDHNNGFVLAATIDMDTLAAVNKTDGNTITVNSVGYPPVTVDINDTEVNPKEYGSSDALVRGVVDGFLKNGRKVGGFVANTHSNIFKGAGVSSSASFELLVSEILNVLYNDGKMGAEEKAIISQHAENVYFGKPSGLMDQLTISRGGVSFMDFADTKNPVSDTAKWTFDDLSLVIINCGGDHCNLTPEYAQIREDMKKAAEFFGESVLRRVDGKRFASSYAELFSAVGGRAVLRAKHYFEENERVLAAVSALNAGDKEKFLSLISASGYSSKEQLQNCTASGDPDENLLFGLKIAEDVPSVKAVRVHGGGFAGTILCMLEKSDSKEFCDYMSTIFGKENVFNLSIRKKGTTQVEV